jgi:RNA polymerase primary sigma factor
LTIEIIFATKYLQLFDNLCIKKGLFVLEAYLQLTLNKEAEMEKDRKKRQRSNHWIADVTLSEIETADLTKKQSSYAKPFWLEGKSPSDIEKDTHVKSSTVCIALKSAEKKIRKLREKKVVPERPNVDPHKNSNSVALSTRDLKIVMGFLRQSARMWKETFANMETLAEQVEKIIAEGDADEKISGKDDQVDKDAEEEVSGQPPEISKPPPAEKIDSLPDKELQRSRQSLQKISNRKKIEVNKKTLARKNPPPKKDMAIFPEEILNFSDNDGNPNQYLADDEDFEPTSTELSKLEKETTDEPLAQPETLDFESNSRNKDLQLFIKEAKKYPLLSREEEYESSRIGELGQKKLAIHNLLLVVKVANRYQNRGMELLDLIQEGSIGLLKAAKKFDHQRGCKFSTYANWWIRQAITRALSDQSRTIRIPVHMVGQLSHFSRIEGYLRQKLERQPEDDEVAKKMELGVEKIRKLRALRNRSKSISLATPVSSHSHRNEAGDLLEDFLSDENGNLSEEKICLVDKKQQFWLTVSQALCCDNNGRIFQIVSARNQGESLKEILGKLGIIQLTNPEKLFYILSRRNINTLEEISREFGLTRERIRQLEAQALKQLQRPKWKNKLKQLL